jgi:type II secretory pathway pseudopilin PulG
METMVVLAIIAILASLLTQALPFLREKTRDGRRIYELDNLRRQIELYKNENGAYPATASGAGYYSFFTNPDAFSGTYSPAQITSTGYVPALVPNYFDSLPVDPNPGDSVIPACAALSWGKNIAYFSNGDHYKIIYNCASETYDYDPNSLYYDPARPTWAWAASDDINYTTYTLGW